MPLLGLSSSQNESACAIRCDGSVWCWGNNAWGQLGDGTTTARATPVRVPDLGGPATVVSTGYSFVCALVHDAVRCWGQNSEGQLGDGSVVDRATPVSVVGLPRPVRAIAAGGIHVCAILDDGSVWCWGGNNRGQLGDGTITGRSTPAAVRALTDAAVELVSGQYHTCARLIDGTVRCWGHNSFGALGDGTASDRSTPVAVNLPDAVVALASASNHTCAVLDSGELWCWGYNMFGAVAPTLTDQLSPVRIATLVGPVRAVATGSAHTCAALDGGELRCWGGNASGQLGDASTTRRLTPTVVARLGGAPVRLSAGTSHTCAALADGRAQCWGSDTLGQLGDGRRDDSAVPVTVLLPP